VRRGRAKLKHHQGRRHPRDGKAPMPTPKHLAGRGSGEAHKGPTRGPQGAHQGPTRGPQGAHKGPTRGPQGAHQGPTRGPQGAHKGPTRSPQGPTLSTDPCPRRPSGPSPSHRLSSHLPPPHSRVQCTHRHSLPHGHRSQDCPYAKQAHPPNRTVGPAPYHTSPNPRHTLAAKTA
jgi:hypothetical protein